MTVKLTGTIVIQADMQSRLLPLLNDHIEASRAEPGNLKFVITQDKTDPSVFHLDEEFTDEDAFAFHQKRGGASPWGEASKDLIRDFKKTED